MFIGNFIHEPNWQTILHLKKVIWPKLRILLPDVSLRVYGAYPPQKALELHKPAERFFIEGRANDVNVVMQEARVLLAPIPFGAGIKGKFIDAMRNGLPSVTTALGSESMDDTLLWNGFICENDDAIIIAAQNLYLDASVWKESVQNGFQLLKVTSDRAKYTTILKLRLESLEANIENQRKDNFLGSILRYQCNQATKFMSLWIAEKNKK